MFSIVFSDRVAVGRALDLPVFFGDAGSREVWQIVSESIICAGSLSDSLYIGYQVLHKVGAERACAAAITLDTPGANYRTVWALSKYFPNVKTFVRAHDVDHGLNLEKAGATAVSCLLPMIYQLVKVVLDFIFPTELMLSNNLQVVPETLEPSLQLAAAVLAQVNNLNVYSAYNQLLQNKHLFFLGALSCFLCC